jgi:arginase family enzyme
MGVKSLPIISLLGNTLSRNSYHIDRLIIKNNINSNIVNFNIDPYSFNYKQLYTTHNNIINLYDNRIITLGNNNSISHSTISSNLQKYKNDLIVIWIDSSTGINQNNDKLIKNINNSPINGLLKLENNWIDNNIPKLRTKNLLYFGIRDITPNEHIFMRTLNIRNYNNLSNILYYIFNNINNNKKIHISFNVNSLDMYLNMYQYGLAPTEIASLIKTMIKYYNVVSIDITGLNPQFNNDENCLKSLEPIISVIINTNKKPNHHFP